MVYPSIPHLFDEIEGHIQKRTGWRIRNLSLEVSPDRALLRGQATTSVARQIAHQVVQTYFPRAVVENNIEVDYKVEILPGIPLS